MRVGVTITINPLRDLFYHARGDSLPQCIPRKYDIILAADCVYFEPAFPLLVKTLAELAPDKSVEVLFCYKKRRKVRSVGSNRGSPWLSRRALRRQINASSPY